MSNSESKPPVQKSANESLPDPDVRFRYIGFDIYPKRIPRFWKSDKEAASYAERVKMGAGLSMQERESSLLHLIPVSKADRIVITVVSAVLLATLAMPWVHFRTSSGSDFSLSWAGALGTLLGGLGNAFAGGIGVGISALLGLILIVGGPVIGLWTLVSLWMKAKSDDAFFLRLRRPLNLGYVLFFSGILAAVLSFFGGDIPGYASWGLLHGGEQYGIMTLLTTLSYGVYASIGMGLVAGVKSADL